MQTFERLYPGEEALRLPDLRLELRDGTWFPRRARIQIRVSCFPVSRSLSEIFGQRVRTSGNRALFLLLRLSVPSAR